MSALKYTRAKNKINQQMFRLVCSRVLLGVHFIFHPILPLLYGWVLQDSKQDIHNMEYCMEPQSHTGLQMINGTSRTLLWKGCNRSLTTKVIAVVHVLMCISFLKIFVLETAIGQYNNFSWLLFFLID